MHRSRLLLVVPAVSALVFTGIAPAAADGGQKEHRASGEITSIEREVEARHGDQVRAEFEYECWGKRGSAEVHLYQNRGVHYAGDVRLRCDGEERTATVDLDRESRDRVSNGKARLEIELYAGSRLLDEAKAKVTVSGARSGDDHRDDGRDEKKDGDKKDGDKKDGDKKDGDKKDEGKEDADQR